MMGKKVRCFRTRKIQNFLKREKQKKKKKKGKEKKGSLSYMLFIYPQRWEPKKKKPKKGVWVVKK